ncbi:MAG: nickel-dependent lactate racemase [Desulfobacteraceae bacterium]|nr:MAG: nickel-dependent lactate racemase [Desulfobacteraceae bacterium]
MMKIQLKKGQGCLDLEIPDEKISGVITGKDVAPIPHEKVDQVIRHGVIQGLPDAPESKQIVVIIPDDTRLWARGDRFVPCIIQALMDQGIPKAKIKLIIALGTHQDMPAELFSSLAGDFSARHVQILNSANTDDRRLVHVGNTGLGTRVEITREAVDADHIIIFGGVLHHMAAGFGGGRKYILPGIAGYDSIQQNHALAMQPDGSAHPMVRQAQLDGNPLHEDMMQAADLFLKGKTCTYVAVAANGEGEIFYADTGDLHTTFQNGCDILNQTCCVKVPEKGDFALISAGGQKTDGQLYQSTKALFNAANIVREGGEILFVAGCAQGVGNPVFASALEIFRNDIETLGKRLTTDFSMPAYVAFRVIDLMQRFKITLASDLPQDVAHRTGFTILKDPVQYISELNGRGYVIPFAENILPIVGRKDNIS